jgi:xanthine dehydrogenase small subunit
VQKSMVNFHGSQCGFCTPGFVMSLFSMYKNFPSFNKKIIKNSIAGNLCRCTGYQPIINAAISLNNKNKVDQFYQTKNETIKLLKIINKKNNSLTINRIDKKYFAPQTINELKILLKKYPKSKILSGGTDLSLIVTKERKTINSIIYINSIKELNYIKKNKKYIEIGATTPLIEFESEIIKHYPDFKDILERYGSVQIRNVATIAGNIATASPIGDTLPLLLALNAKIVISNSKNDKILYLKDFFINYRKTKLKNGQFIKLIKIPLLQNNIFKAYKISKRIDDDISAVCASFNLNIKNNIIVSISIAYGGMAAIPKKALQCEKSLLNKDLSEKNINIAQKFLEKDFNPIDDMRASSQYRMKIAKNLLFKCFQEIKNNKLIRINV